MRRKIQSDSRATNVTRNSFPSSLEWPARALSKRQQIRGRRRQFVTRFLTQRGSFPRGSIGARRLGSRRDRGAVSADRRSTVRSSQTRFHSARASARVRNARNSIVRSHDRVTAIVLSGGRRKCDPNIAEGMIRGIAVLQSTRSVAPTRAARATQADSSRQEIGKSMYFLETSFDIFSNCSFYETSISLPI